MSRVLCVEPGTGELGNPPKASPEALVPELTRIIEEKRRYLLTQRTSTQRGISLAHFAQRDGQLMRIKIASEPETEQVPQLLLIEFTEKTLPRAIDIVRACITREWQLIS